MQKSVYTGQMDAGEAGAHSKCCHYSSNELSHIQHTKKTQKSQTLMHPKPIDQQQRPSLQTYTRQDGYLNTSNTKPHKATCSFYADPMSEPNEIPLHVRSRVLAIGLSYPVHKFLTATINFHQCLLIVLPFYSQISTIPAHDRRGYLPIACSRFVGVSRPFRILKALSLSSGRTQS